MRKSLKTDSKKEAKRRALVIERDLLAGKLSIDKRPPLIADIAAAFLETKEGDGLAESTLAKYGFCVGQMKQVAEELGVKRVSEIDAYFMDKFRKRRTELLSKRPGRDGQNTATKDLVTIREIVNYALELKLIHDDPLAGYSIKKVKTKPLSPTGFRTSSIESSLPLSVNHIRMYTACSDGPACVPGKILSLADTISTSTTGSRFKRRKAGSPRLATLARCRCPRRSSSCWPSAAALPMGLYVPGRQQRARLARSANAGCSTTSSGC